MPKRVTTIGLLCCLFVASSAWAQTFAPTATSLQPTQQGALKLGDLNADGRLDIVQTGLDAAETPRTFVYRNEGGSAASWTFAATDTGLPDLTASTVDVGDFDNDGDLDILVVGSRESDVYRNEGNFRFAPLGLPLQTVTLIGGVQELVNTPSAAWGDYDSDGDLDILLTGVGGSSSQSLIYRNAAGTFEPVSLGLPVMLGGSVEWGDFDNDGDPDILATHQPGPAGAVGFTAIFRNDAGQFVRLDTALPGTDGSKFETGVATWGDYDNDGFLDVLFTASSNSERAGIGVYRNQGDGTFAATPVPLPAAYYGAWLDFDNDGARDVLLNRTAPGGTAATKSSATRTHVEFYRNAQTGFTEAESVPGVLYGAIASGDVTGDGLADVLVMGRREEDGRPAELAVDLYHNTRGTNQAPFPPTGLRSNRQGSTLILRWDAATDPETPSATLTYNVRVGTTPGGSDVLSPMALDDGTRLVAAPGNAGLSVIKVLRGLDPMKSYYWAVQALDANHVGSTFAEETVSTDIEARTDLPSQIRLDENYPNPFNPGTTIQYEVPSSMTVRLAVYNVLGAQVAVLHDGVRAAGTHEAYWDGRNTQGQIVPSGLYVYRLETPTQSLSRTMVLLK